MSPRQRDLPPHAPLAEGGVEIEDLSGFPAWHPGASCSGFGSGQVTLVSSHACELDRSSESVPGTLLPDSRPGGRPGGSWGWEAGRPARCWGSHWAQTHPGSQREGHYSEPEGPRSVLRLASPRSLPKRWRSSVLSCAPCQAGGRCKHGRSAFDREDREPEAWTAER